ncbi:MAG: TolC family protein [Calditrichaeota bacterium]|nr:MAG: TolC family protein [Calditrichota bacterium]MBL1206165.1 TolC family protein [Calditrichota bacterium]NOG45990.1 TolC family protein [Calditrichota bacterium]
MKLYITLIYVLLNSFLFAQSLQEAVAEALENNDLVNAGRQAVVEAQYLERSTFAGTLPTLDFTGSARYVTHVPEIDFPALPGLSGQSITLGSKDTYEVGIGLNYTLFSGFAQTASEQLASEKIILARLSLLANQKEIALKTVQLYRGVQLLDIADLILDAGHKRLNLQFDRLKIAVQNGYSLAVDTLSLKLSVLKIEQRKSDIAVRRANLVELLQIATGKNFQVLPFEANLGKALDSPFNPDKNEQIRKIDSKEKQLDIKNDIIKSSYYPKIGLQAFYKYGKPGLDFIKDEWMDYGVLAVGLQWNLWSWSTHRNQLEANNAKMLQVGFEKNSLKEQVKTSYEKSIRNYEHAQKSLAVFQMGNKLARQKMKIIETQYQEGSVSTTDYNLANQELIETELDLKKQMIEISLKISEIDFYSGKPVSEWRLN